MSGSGAGIFADIDANAVVAHAFECKKVIDRLDDCCVESQAEEVAGVDPQSGCLGQVFRYRNGDCVTRFARQAVADGQLELQKLVFAVWREGNGKCRRLEARIVEASTSFSNEVGIQWGGNFTMAPAFGNPTGLAFPAVIGVAGGADAATAPSSGLLTSNPNFAVNLPAAVAEASNIVKGETWEWHIEDQNMFVLSRKTKRMSNRGSQ